jgi:hypothetical protein
MSTETSTSLSDIGGRRPRFQYRAGDLVVSASGYPTVYEVISVCDDGLLRLCGVDWPRAIPPLSRP